MSRTPNKIYGGGKGTDLKVNPPSEDGRFPANVVVTGKALDESKYFDIDLWAEKNGIFQTPKPSTSERNAGLENSDLKEKSVREEEGDPEDWDLSEEKVRARFVTEPQKNFHPTVKPIQLMSWLVQLVSKEGDTVLDPFMGSGTTAIACLKLNRNYIGIERNPDYCKIAEERIKNVKRKQSLWS